MSMGEPDLNPKNAAYRAAKVQALRDELADICRRAFAQGLPDCPDAMVEPLFDEMRARWGGGEVWIPAPSTARRNADIRSMFNGRNLSAVCRHFGLSPSTVYRIVGRPAPRPPRPKPAPAAPGQFHSALPTNAGPA